MREFQLGRYIKKWMLLIIVFFVVMTVLAHQAITKKQTYIASTVIEYCNDGAIDGKAPDGTTINTAEIYSSANMARTMKHLGISLGDYGLDRLCKSITVTPVMDEQASLIMESVNKEGLEYTTQPTTYIVSCELDYTGSKSKAQMILNQLLDEYYSDYSSKHINSAVLSNQTAGILDTDYDYLEMIELIDSQLSDTLSDLNVNYSRDRQFRSARTGYSYAELYDQFSLLHTIDVSELYAMVLGNQVTKDRDLLINKYSNRIEDYALRAGRSREQINDALAIVDSYVQKMRSSGNTDIDFNYILTEVYDNSEYDSESGRHVISTERTVQYDKLLRHWLSDKSAEDYAIVQSAYCQYIINVFTNGATGLSAFNAEQADPVDELISVESAEAADGLTAGVKDQAVPANSREAYMGPVSTDPLTVGQADEAMVTAALRALLDKLQVLYAITEQTTEEYNEYLGAQNIRTLSSTETRDGMNVTLYTVLIAFFFLVVGCCGAILIGRAEDILEYVFYRDNDTGVMNRLACDNYIKKQANDILTSNRACLSVRILNRRQLNEKLGREGTDKLIGEVAAVLKSCYHNQQESFIGNNGGGHFIVFYNLLVGDTAMDLERLRSTLQLTVSSSDIEYEIGIACAGEEKLYNIRQLLSRAIEKQQRYSNS